MAGDEVTPATLVLSSLISNPEKRVKLLGFGEVGRAVTVRGCAVSKSARAKIESAGGRIEA